MASPSIQNMTFPALGAAYLLALIPAGYSAMLSQIKAGSFDNCMPRQNADRVKGKVSPEVHDEINRAMWAHRNGLEIFPLFAATMLAGNLANLPVAELNTLATHFLVSRILYNIVYIKTPRHSGALSYLRSIIFHYGSGLCIIKLFSMGGSLFGA